MISTININQKNISLINQLLEKSENSLKNFRYFNKRPIEIILTHIVTLGILLKDSIIGYGHLEEESGKIWLGIVVTDECQGMGVGKLILTNLICQAKFMNIDKIWLSVDSSNKRALGLYMSNNFVIDHSHENVYFLYLTL